MQLQQFQQLAELFPSGTLLLSGAGIILAASPRVITAWNWDPAQIVGQNLSALLTNTAQDVATFLQACLGSNQVIAMTVTSSASGKELAVEGRRIDAEAGSGEASILVTGAVGGAANLNLTEVAEGVELRDRLLALLVHDFRNGLASVPMGFDILEMEHGKSETVGLLRRQVDRLVLLVDDVLENSRLLRGKVVLNRAPVVVQDILSEVSNHVAKQFKQRNLTIELVMPAEPVAIEADPQRLAQALKTLVLQRSKNMPVGGRITFSLLRESADVAIRMQDTGQAIDQELIPHVFDLLAQLRLAIQGHRTQFELGLALVGGLITLQGGRIAAQALPTPPGMETTIQFPLPPGA